MERILRAWTGPTIANVRDVSLGLLQADRNQRGDEAVFASLVEQVQQGHVSDEVIVHLFAMLEEDYGRINPENASVIDALLDRLDLTDARRASQLAEICAQVGQLDRAKRLYQFCASLTTTGAISYAGLIAQAKETFDGDELMALAESMYELTNQTNSEAAVLLDLRLELLDPKSAAERSVGLIDNQETDDVYGEMRKAIRAVPVFACAGDYDNAADCLKRALRKHGQPRSSTTTSMVYYSSVPRRVLLSVGRQDLIHIFPETASDYVDYDAWLREAAEAARQVAEETKPEILVETLLTIAFRQCQRGKMDEATETASWITDEMMAEAGQHELLAIDVMRLAGLSDRSLQLQTKLYDQQRLSHLRFGDLLRDTAAVKGNLAASRLLDELVEQTMDQDLIRAAEEIAEGDPQLVDRAQQLRSQWQAAKNEYESRIEAAQQRAESRKQWREDDAARRKPVNADAKREPSSSIEAG
jgi:hypothetical protein